jgi:hypothetical protein
MTRDAEIDRDPDGKPIRLHFGSGAKQPAFGWPLGIAAGALFEIIPGSERHAGGLAGTVIRGVRISDSRDVPDAPRSSWPADSVEWVSVAGLVGVDPKEVRAWLSIIAEWIAEEHRAPSECLLEAMREDALRIVLEGRQRSRRKRKDAEVRDGTRLIESL